jgi:predicted house-cleaning NTP pyrophosphatase (Maf/HAM1 superfamily)
MLAKHKAYEVFQRIKGDSKTNDLLVIGADTIVAKGDKIYGKPKNKEDAIDMLLRYI